MTAPNSTQTRPRRSFVPFLVGLPIAFAFIVFILLVMQYKQVRALVSSQKGEISIVPISSDLEARAIRKVQTFLAKPITSSDSTGRDSLVLSEGDLNQIMRYSPAIAPDKETYQLVLRDSLVEMINVMPAAKLKGPVAWMVKLFKNDGWLNSRLQGTVDFEKGRVRFTLNRAIMNGIDAPVENFNRDGKLDPHRMVSDTTAFNEAISKLSGIKLEKGELKLYR